MTSTRPDGMPPAVPAWKRLRLIAAAAIFLIWSPQPARSASPDPNAVQEQVTTHIAEARKAQKGVEAWEAERKALLARARELRMKQQWLTHQIGRHTAYIQQREEEIRELTRREEEGRRLQMELAPYLDTLADRIADDVATDLPFLKAERQERLSRLHAALEDYHLTLAEKAGRVFEALQIEAEYGSSVEHTEGEILLEGAQTRVDLLRIGRTALFYRTPDGRSAGRYDPESGQWTPLSATDGREIGEALEMADKKRSPDLLILPLGREEKTTP